MNKINRIYFFIIVSVLIVFDQISKFMVVVNKDNLPQNLVFGLIDFTYCENRGIAFGFASGHVRLFSIITLLIIIAIVIAIFINYNKMGQTTAIGTAFLIAGGVGNLIDRTFRLFVVDFIDIGKIFNFPIFNFADICVVVGVIFIGISCLFYSRGESVEKNNNK